MLAAGGFPYVINQSGSYKLSGNLTVPNGSTTAIVIAADHVTIDLNGFSIMGPVVCSGTFPCSGSGTGYGIVAGTDAPVKNYFDITIRNGTIQGMGADGVHLLGDSFLLEYLHVRSNGQSGLVVRAAGVITGQKNALVYHNTVQVNGNYGIKVAGGMITNNTISESVFEGMKFDATGGYLGNQLLNNNGGGSQIVGGINLGQNICGTAVCP